MVLITGASGCGKSTLALTLAGLIPSRVHGELRGRVMFEGKPLSGLAPHEASQFVGMVFQNPNLQLINMTVQSEVAFGPENLALPQPEVAARVDWALEVTGMAGMRTATVVTLSGGQKQRTVIAATLAMRPRLLVLDEPLSDLDPVGAQEVLGTLRRLAADEGTGVIVIEHRVDEVVPWADRIVLMDDGKIILDRPPRGAWDDIEPWTPWPAAWRTGGHPGAALEAQAPKPIGWAANQVPRSLSRLPHLTQASPCCPGGM